jgi:predicted nucleic acid binding AN1-type Zn finger protein
MEFSDLGAHCFKCNKQDYLPFKCNKCFKFFCLEHKSFDSHNCSSINSPDLFIPKKKVKKNICHICNKNEIIELKCKVCNKVTCITHRHSDDHNCTNDIKSNDLKNNCKCIIT